MSMSKFATKEDYYAMSNRRNRPPNRVGCKPDGDVCVAHDMPLECRHGCGNATPHKCKERERQDEILKRAGLLGERDVIK